MDRHYYFKRREESLTRNKVFPWAKLHYNGLQWYKVHHLGFKKKKSITTVWHFRTMNSSMKYLLLLKGKNTQIHLICLSHLGTLYWNWFSHLISMKTNRCLAIKIDTTYWVFSQWTGQYARFYRHIISYHKLVAEWQFKSQSIWLENPWSFILAYFLL